jgi:hypothetical protein
MTDSVSSLTKRLVREAEEKLEKYTHPDRYVFNYMPGGSRFMRNAPIPLDVRLLFPILMTSCLARVLTGCSLQVCFPDGVPEGEEVSPLEAINIDMTPLPERKGVFVDFSKKGYD